MSLFNSKNFSFTCNIHIWCSFTDLVACNGRKLVTEPEWTRVRPSLNQKSIIDSDAQLMKASGYVHVDSTDIGCSDHYPVWMELGRTTKTTRKAKHVIRKWRL